MSVEMNCPGCGDEALLRREPVYEGFTKTGETLTCSSCGHVFASEGEVPFLDGPKRPAVFSAADRSRKVEIFESDEKGRNCRYCAHYVVNPFIQRCGLHHKEVAATDLCADFSPTEEDDVSRGEPEPSS